MIALQDGLPLASQSRGVKIQLSLGGSFRLSFRPVPEAFAEFEMASVEGLSNGCSIQLQLCFGYLNTVSESSDTDI